MMPRIDVPRHAKHALVDDVARPHAGKIRRPDRRRGCSRRGRSDLPARRAPRTRRSTCCPTGTRPAACRRRMPSAVFRGPPSRAPAARGRERPGCASSNAAISGLNAFAFAAHRPEVDDGAASAACAAARADSHSPDGERGAPTRLPAARKTKARPTFAESSFEWSIAIVTRFRASLRGSTANRLPHDSRTTSSDSSVSFVAGRFGLSSRWHSRSTAAAPMADIGTRTVVSRGRVIVAIRVSSKPTTGKSPGHSQARCRAPRR